MKPRKPQDTMICDNPRFYCLSKRAHPYCDCGGKLHNTNTPEGARLKQLRETKKGAISAGDSRPPKKKPMRNRDNGEAVAIGRL